MAVGTSKFASSDGANPHLKIEMWGTRLALFFRVEKSRSFHFLFVAPRVSVRMTAHFLSDCHPEWSLENFLLLRVPGDLDLGCGVTLRTGLVDRCYPTLVLHEAIQFNVLMNALDDIELIIVLRGATG